MRCTIGTDALRYAATSCAVVWKPLKNTPEAPVATPIGMGPVVADCSRSAKRPPQPSLVSDPGVHVAQCSCMSSCEKSCGGRFWLRS